MLKPRFWLVRQPLTLGKRERGGRIGVGSAQSGLDLGGDARRAGGIGMAVDVESFGRVEIDQQVRNPVSTNSSRMMAASGWASSVRGEPGLAITKSGLAPRARAARAVRTNTVRASAIERASAAFPA